MKIIKIVLAFIIIFSYRIQAQTLLDTTIFVDSRNSSWQSTGITIESSDYLYLFSWGAVITHKTSMGNKLGAYLVGSDNTKGDNMVPYANAGLGIVMKIGNNTPWPVGQVFRATHWTNNGGELYLGFNDNYHVDNQGSMIVGILKISGLTNSSDLLDTTIPVDSRNSSWQSTGITIKSGDYIYLFSWGAVITHQTSMGNKLGAYLVGSDNTKGDNMVPYANAGLGIVMKIGDNTPWPAGQVFRSTHWTESGGELYLGFNDNYHADNQGSMIVGILKISNVLTNLTNKILFPPNYFQLNQNFPNPFNPDTKISFSIPTTGYVSLVIYNQLGKKVIALVNEKKNPGNYLIGWDGKDKNGNIVSSGIYNYRLKFNNQYISKSMILIR